MEGMAAAANAPSSQRRRSNYGIALFNIGVMLQDTPCDAYRTVLRQLKDGGAFAVPLYAGSCSCVVHIWYQVCTTRKARLL